MKCFAWLGIPWLAVVMSVSASADDYLVIDLSAGPAAERYPVAYVPSVPEGGWTDEHKSTQLVLRRIPAGTFRMGSPADELGRDAVSERERRVTLTEDFYIGVFPVTQRQWERVMGDWPAYFHREACRDTRPVESVTFEDIRGSDQGAAWPVAAGVDSGSFVRRLRERTELDSLDLPTEAQWEYACRAGTEEALNSGMNLSDERECPNLSELGRYWHNGGSSFAQDGDLSGGTAAAGSYLPNDWGLYDMHGNVWEWCLDWHEDHPATTTDPAGPATGLYRALRGGGWYYGLSRQCRSAARIDSLPSYRYFNFGFRIAMSAPAMELPAGEGPLEFGGVNWKPWRTQFEVRGDKLMTRPKARSGFRYGQSGNGRNATLATNVGNKEWTDYRLEFAYCMTGVDPSFNPHGLPLDLRRGGIMFRVADAKESWNERGWSNYTLSLNINGSWRLASRYHVHCRTTTGYGRPHIEGVRVLAEGDGLELDSENGNLYRIEVRGERLQIWVDGKQIVDVRDEKMGEPIGGQTLEHGGVGFYWTWECMGWIGNFSATPL